MLSTYYCWRPVFDGYECLQLLEQNGGFGNNGAQPPMQIHNVHNNAGTTLLERQYCVGALCVCVCSVCLEQCPKHSVPNTPIKVVRKVAVVFVSSIHTLVVEGETESSLKTEQ